MGISFKMEGHGAGKLAQWLRALVVAAKDLGSIPSTHMDAHHRLGYQAHMWQMDVPAGKTLIHLK